MPPRAVYPYTRIIIATLLVLPSCGVAGVRPGRPTLHSDTGTRLPSLPTPLPRAGCAFVLVLQSWVPIDVCVPPVCAPCVCRGGRWSPQRVRAAAARSWRFFARECGVPYGVIFR